MNSCANLILIILTVTILGYLYYSKRENMFFDPLTSKCNANTDVSCNLYNHRDIKSKCNSLCANNHKGTIYNDNHTFNKETGDHTCECITPEHFTTDFSLVSNLGDKILDTKILEDETDRNTRDQQFEKRYKDLVFGV